MSKPLNGSALKRQKNEGRIEFLCVCHRPERSSSPHTLPFNAAHGAFTHTSHCRVLHDLRKRVVPLCLSLFVMDELQRRRSRCVLVNLSCSSVSCSMTRLSDFVWIFCPVSLQSLYVQRSKVTRVLMNEFPVSLRLFVCVSGCMKLKQAETSGGYCRKKQKETE